jgi:subtilisin-like proprotein convertase family protein
VLVLQNLKPVNAGLYAVEIESPCGRLTNSATLTLEGGPLTNPLVVSNESSLFIPSFGSAAPYPSTLNIKCVPGQATVTNLTVQLHGVTHSWPSDLDVLLVNPAGQPALLMSDCGGNDSFPVSGVNLTFSDMAVQALPESSQIVSGVYRPTEYPNGEAFPPPAPAGPYPVALAPLLGSSANGTWSLYVVDDLRGNGGTIQGWTLSIGWDTAPPWLSGARVLPDGRFEVSLHGLVGLAHSVEGSADFRSWTPLTTFTPAAEVTTLLIEPQAGGWPYRFYRAVRCP